MRDLLVGPVLLTSLLAGVVALLAPCCVSVMLPAYLSTVFRRRATVLAATLVFALGVATVIMPIGLGASALSAVFQSWHTPIFGAGGVLMVAGGAATLAGWSPKIPMPGGRSTNGGGIGAVYALGVFSGIASACCAPVLIGVSVLAGATGSFPAALSVSLTYVVGMVAPLLIMSLGVDRWGAKGVRALQARQVSLRPGAGWRVALGSLMSGLLLIGMGVLTIVLAITGPDMPTTGWRVTFTADLQHTTAVLGTWLGWLPGWVIAVALVAVVTGLGYAAARRPEDSHTAQAALTELSRDPSGTGTESEQRLPTPIATVAAPAQGHHHDR